MGEQWKLCLLHAFEDSKHVYLPNTADRLACRAEIQNGCLVHVKHYLPDDFGW